MKGMKEERRNEVRQKGTERRPLGREGGYRCFRKVCRFGKVSNIDTDIDFLLVHRSTTSKLSFILRQRFWIRCSRNASQDGKPIKAGQAYSISERIIPQ